jgi:dynein heavy chain
MCESLPTENRWMIMDGPVDTLWIETMNSVLDDSKLLTLTNGDRIKIESHVNLLFEVENLDVASPATVSRAGMIYLDIEELHWKSSIIESWIKGKADQKEDFQERLRECVANYLEKVITVKKVSCRELVKTSESACIRNFCNLFDCLALKDFRFTPGEDREAYLTYVEKWFVFALIWSVGCTVESESRVEIEQIIREVMTGIPLTGTVYDYYINPDRKDF